MHKHLELYRKVVEQFQQCWHVECLICTYTRFNATQKLPDTAPRYVTCFCSTCKRKIRAIMSCTGLDTIRFVGRMFSGNLRSVSDGSFEKRRGKLQRVCSLKGQRVIPAVQHMEKESASERASRAGFLLSPQSGILAVILQICCSLVRNQWIQQRQ